MYFSTLACVGAGREEAVRLPERLLRDRGMSSRRSRTLRGRLMEGLAEMVEREERAPGAGRGAVWRMVAIRMMGIIRLLYQGVGFF